MVNLMLTAKTRNLLGKKIRSLRQQNKIPAVIYGHGLKSQPLMVDYLLFQKIYEKAGESTLVDLKVDEQASVKVVIQDVQFDPLTDRFLHVDFHKVKMTEKMITEIPLKFIGESPAVKEKGGILVKNIDKVKIECLPNDLIHEINVDISVLKNFEESLHVKDLPIPEGISVFAKPEETVVLVETPRSEEELKALEEKEEAPITEEGKEAKTTDEKAEGGITEKESQDIGRDQTSKEKPTRGGENKSKRE